MLLRFLCARNYEHDEASKLCPSPCPSPSCPCFVDYYTLLRFLRARNYEHDKAFKMWTDSLAWRREFDVDNILDDFVFYEREQFLMAYVRGRGS